MLLSLASLVVVVLPVNAIRLVLVGGTIDWLVPPADPRSAGGWHFIAAAATALTLARAEWFTLPGHRRDLADPGLDVHVPADRLPLRSAEPDGAVQRVAVAGVFLHAAERLLSDVSAGGLPDVQPHVFQRADAMADVPGGDQVDLPRHGPPAAVPAGAAELRSSRPTTWPTPADLVRYMVTTFLLYLQISGQFHIIIGLLHLFGFNLPETHHNYLLSSSFTDFWRRINIYWKDFIQKVFFNPVYFRVKHWGPTAAMTVATLVAFFFTWLLHSYQWFWIRGTFPMTWQDAVFWGVLAVLVLVNVLYEQRYGRSRRSRARSGRSGREWGWGCGRSARSA